jgi:DNA-binding transcriptional LysR family regulator
LKYNNTRELRDWVIFIKTIEKANLSLAARELGVSVSTVSKAISRLEDYVQTMLIKRDARNFEITSAGHIAYSKAKNITESFQSLLSELQNPELLIQGDIKFSVPSVVCQLLANHWTSEYIIKNPMARVEIKSQELFEFNHDVKNFDHVALQYGNIQRPELVHRELNSVELISCASPEYINKFNMLDRPDSFEGHTLLMVDNCNLKDNMIFTKGDETISLDKNHKPSIKSNDFLALFNLLLEGKGLLLGTPKWLALTHIRNGELVQIIPDWKLANIPVYLVWMHRPYYSPLFLDFINYVEKKWNNFNQVYLK